MCGLVGIYNSVEWSEKKIANNAIRILKKLEYRGYDSAGLSIMFNDMPPETIKCIGKVDNLAMQSNCLKYQSKTAKGALAHTRWATNGKVNELNCHPHHSMKGVVYLVHNGIIENADDFKKKLIDNGYKFYGDTDSEILANFLEFMLLANKPTNKDEVFRIIDSSLLAVTGTYGLAIFVKYEFTYGSQTMMFGFHRGSPLVFGEYEGGYILCSDLNSMCGVASKATVLPPGCNVMIQGMEATWSQSEIQPNFKELSESEEYNCNGFPDYTMKEIHQQGFTLKQTLAGRVDGGNVVISALDDNARFLKNVKRVIIVAEGTSYHAGLVGRHFIENLSDVRVEVELASDYFYNIKNFSDDDLVVFISQSGETADVIKCLRECSYKFVKTMAITNGVDSQLSREVDFGIYLRCGVEIGVASTKAFTSTILVLYLFACKLGRFDRLPPSALADPDSWIPGYLDISKIDKNISDIVNAIDVSKLKSFVFLGKCEYKAIAMEAALKMNELSYIPSLAYSTGSLKHGPLGLVADDIQFIVLDNDEKYDADSNLCISQLKARNAKVMRLGFRGKTQLYRIFSLSIALQLLAYYVAKKLGNDIDKPRNLAKSVTVN